MLSFQWRRNESGEVSGEQGEGGSSVSSSRRALSSWNELILDELMIEGAYTRKIKLQAS